MTLRFRPSGAVRAGIGLVAVAVVVANATLLLADRAPRLLRAVFGDWAQRISARLDARGGATAALEARVGDDSIVHFGLWAAAMFVVGLAVWQFAGLAIASAAVAATSLLLEVAQGRYSSTRAVEASDAMFNLLGVATGAVGAAAVFLAVEGVGRLVSGPARPPAPSAPARSG